METKRPPSKKCKPSSIAASEESSTSADRTPSGTLTYGRERISSQQEIKSRENDGDE